MNDKKIQITSFDAEDAGVFGDVLTQPLQRKKAQVGLLALGYFEYWRMYTALEAQVESDRSAAAARLKAALPDCDVTYPGMVDTLDKAETAGMAFRNAEIDPVRSAGVQEVLLFHLGAQAVFLVFHMMKGAVDMADADLQLLYLALHLRLPGAQRFGEFSTTLLLVDDMGSFVDAEPVLEKRAERIRLERVIGRKASIAVFRTVQLEQPMFVVKAD
jgi:hypothetical protein